MKKLKMKKFNIGDLNLNTILAGVFGLALLVIGGVFLYNKVSSKDSITVTGKATHEVKNQIASFSITVEISNANKVTAVTAAEKGASEAIAAIKDFGIPDEDVKTQHLNVYQRDEPIIRQGTTKYEPGDWYASYSVEVTLRDLNRSSELTALLASFPSSTMWGPNLRVDPDEIDEESILNDAVEDAKQKAEALAKQSGKRLGKILNITEGGSMPYDTGLVRSEGLGGAGFPVEPGTSSVTKTVTVTFRLK